MLNFQFRPARSKIVLTRKIQPDTTTHPHKVLICACTLGLKLIMVLWRILHGLKKVGLTMDNLEEILECHSDNL